MEIPSSMLRHYGPVKVGRVHRSGDLRELLEGEGLDSGVFIVKPNWLNTQKANFTNSETLRILLESLDGKLVVTESYMIGRQDGSMKFVVDGVEVDWRWLQTHPNWDWMKEKGRWERLRKMDEWFLDEYGFTELFNEFDVEYVNVTEEFWQGRMVDVGKVKKKVEERYAPVKEQRMYGFVPKKLYDLNDPTLISFAKIKGIMGTNPSLSVKNLFGFIPDPLKSWWHGPRNERLADSIVDINKVYDALFRVFGLCEAIHTGKIIDPEGDLTGPSGRYRIARDQGVVALGKHLVSLDAITCALIRADFEKVPYLQKATQVFGRYEETAVAEARDEAEKWFKI